MAPLQPTSAQAALAVANGPVMKEPTTGTAFAAFAGADALELDAQAKEPKVVATAKTIAM
jgi:hypothetical protein